MNRIKSSRTWYCHPRPSLSDIQKEWLTKQGALTSALREIGPLTLRVLAEFSAGATPDEACCLGLTVLSPVWNREVVMSINGVECVAARSVTPLRASHGIWQGMRRLKSRPLADILYDNVAIKRSDFEVASLTRQTALYRTAYPIARDVQAMSCLPPTLLARRSVFWRQGTPLLVAECFLPTFWKML